MEGLILIALGLWFIPIIVAMSRNHPQAGAITILTIFGSWTAILWIVALAWAFTNQANPNNTGTHG